MQLPNLPYIRSIPLIGPYIYEALQQVQQGVSTIETQAGTNSQGDPPTPSPVQAIQVQGQNGFFHVALVDQSLNLLRPVKYFVEHADNPAFTSSQTEDLGSVRNKTIFLGASTRYFRAYSAYANGPASTPIYFGGHGSPTPVAAGGNVPGAPFLPSQGTGTGAPNQGAQGPGPVAARSQKSGFDWTKQRAIYSSQGILAAQLPGGGAFAGGGSGGGGGGGITPVSVPQNLNLIFFGDSLTAGYYNSLTNPYPSKVGELLNIPATQIHNLGAAGAQSSTVIASQVTPGLALFNAAFRYNWCILLIGVNDFLQGVSISTTQANIASIFSTMNAAGFITLAVFNTPQNFQGSVGPPPQPPTPPGWETWRNTMRAWYQAGSSGATYVSYAGDMNVFSNVTLTQWYDSDQLHNSDLNYLLHAAAVGDYILAALGGTNQLLPPQSYGPSVPVNTNFRPYDINVEDYGVWAGTNGVSTWNTQQIEAAAAQAYANGVGLRFPGQFYNVDKTNIPYGIRIYSTCETTASGIALWAPGTRLVCSGAGTSWLTGVLNFAVPNSGNTGPSTTSQTFGLQVSGIVCDVASGVTGINGIWAVRQYGFVFTDCGVFPNTAAAWAAPILLDTGVIGNITRPYAYYTSSGGTGIALGGPNSTGPSVAVNVFDPVISNCHVGFGSAFAQYCNLYRGSIQSCGTGYVGAGPQNSLFGVVFGSGGATNTTDYTELASSTPPYGGSAVANNYKTLSGCTFNSPVLLLGSTGTSILDNTCNSTLNINSACAATVLNQQLKFFTSFTDSSTTTYYTGPTVYGTGAPTGSQGIRTQRYVDTTTSGSWVEYIVQTSGTPATWQKLTGGGATSPGGTNGQIQFNNAGAFGGVTLVPVSSGGTGTATPGLVAGTNITSITGTWPNQTINAAAAETWSSFSPTITATGGGTITASGSPNFQQSSLGRVSMIFNFTVTGTITGFTISLPFTPPRGGGGAIAWGNGVVGLPNFWIVQAGVAQIIVGLTAGATAGTGFSYGTGSTFL